LKDIVKQLEVLKYQVYTFEATPANTNFVLEKSSRLVLFSIEILHCK